jgi:hypothetical protein
VIDGDAVDHTPADVSALQCVDEPHDIIRTAAGVPNEEEFIGHIGRLSGGLALAIPLGLARCYNSARWR